MKNQISIVLLILLFPILSLGQKKHSENLYNTDKSGLAIEGYDPVAYFTEQKAVEGKKEISFTHEGKVYHFKSSQNLETFKSNPSKIEPQYGGWCAYAMGDSGDKVKIDPKTFKILDGKLYLFYNKFFNNTKTTWNKNEATLKSKADNNWAKLSK